MIISLYNITEHPPTAPLLLYLPPLPQPHIKATEKFEGDEKAEPESFTSDLATPPDYLMRLNIPIVSIRYRWAPAAADGGDSEESRRETKNKVPPLTQVWPTPLHDVMFAYDWIRHYLAPPAVVVAQPPGGAGRPSHAHKARSLPRRDLYVYGSHLGAGLATALALTESHTNRRMAIRGVAAYNGIYNWTAFVRMASDGIPTADGASALGRIVPGTPPLSSLFETPADLFDSFSSPCLFFRTPGLVVPPVDFDEEVNRTRIEEAELRLEELEDRAALDVNGVPVPKRETSVLMMGLMQKSYLAFPSLQSTLSIPPALLLHTLLDEERADVQKADAAAAAKHGGGRKPKLRKIPQAVHGKNSYAVQADEMASLMRRSIDKYEMKRKKVEEQVLLPEYTAVENDNEADSRTSESDRRVRVYNVRGGQAGQSLELDEDGQQMLLSWLDEHMKRPEPGKGGPKL